MRKAEKKVKVEAKPAAAEGAGVDHAGAVAEVKSSSVILS